jgi:hypothetical protein
VNALANPEVGKLVNEHFVCSFQRVGTFRIVGKQKQGGNVATYFCAPDGRVLHAIAGPVNAQQMVQETRWVVDNAVRCMKEAKNDGAKFKALFRTAHAEKLRQQYGLVVQPVTFDPLVDQDPNSALTYRDPTGRPLAPQLPPSPINGPDVKFRFQQEALLAKAGGLAPTARVHDLRGRAWVLPNQGRVHQLLSAHCMSKIEDVYGAVFQGILGERITTRPVEVVTPFATWSNAQRAKGG